MKTTIRKALVMSLGIEMAVVSVLMTFFIGSSVKKQNTQQITKSISTQTEKRALSVEKQLMEQIYAAEALSGILGGSWVVPEKNRRQTMEQELRAMVKSSSVSSAFAYWLPNTFDTNDELFIDSEDNPTGQFMMHYIKDKNGRIKNDAVSDLSLFEMEQLAKNYNASISEPVEVVIDEEKVLSTRVYSHIVNSIGQNVGVAGIDIVLSGLSGIVDGSSIYNGTTCEFVSASGNVAASSNGEITGTVSKYFKNKDTKFYFTGNSENPLTRDTVTFTANIDGIKKLVTVAKITVDRTDNLWFYISETPIANINTAAWNTISTVIIAFIIQIVLVLVILFLAVSRISNPLKTSVQALKNISEGDGDLTVRLESDLNNEIGEMAESFNKTMGKIGNSIMEAKVSAEEMDVIGSDLHDSMEETTESIKIINESIASVQNQMIDNAAGVHEAKAVVDQIVKNIEVLNDNIDRQAESVQSSSASIEQMTQNIRSVSKILETNQQTMNTLGEASEKGLALINNTAQLSATIQERSRILEEASKVIKNIASQTNLLAMNAAIEAAHAGKSGQGFSVVSNEIRKLAEESSVQGAKMQTALKEVQSVINQVSSATIEAQQQFDTIFTLTKTVTEQEQYINQAMKEQTEGGTLVLEEIHKITSITSNVKNGSNEMMDGSKQISYEMDNISQLTTKVDSDMRNMTEMVQAINNASQKADDCVNRNVEAISKLKIAMDKFKVE